MPIEEQVSELTDRMREVSRIRHNPDPVRPGDLIPKFVPGSVCARMSDEVRTRLRQLETKYGSDSGFGRVLACFDGLNITKALEDDKPITSPHGQGMAYTSGADPEAEPPLIPGVTEVPKEPGFSTVSYRQGKFKDYELVENERPFVCETHKLGGVSRVFCIAPIKLGPDKVAIQKKIDKLERDAAEFNKELIERAKKKRPGVEPIGTYIDDKGVERAKTKYKDYTEPEKKKLQNLRVRRLHLLGGSIRYEAHPRWPITIPGQSDKWPEVISSICKA